MAEFISSYPETLLELFGITLTILLGWYWLLLLEIPVLGYSVYKEVYGPFKARQKSYVLSQPRGLEA